MFYLGPYHTIGFLIPHHRSSDEDREKIETAVDGLVTTLVGAGVRAKADKRSGYSPGWKFNQAEVSYAMTSLSIQPTNRFIFPARWYSIAS